jgi:hypothetical protein
MEFFEYNDGCRGQRRIHSKKNVKLMRSLRLVYKVRRKYSYSSYQGE